MKRKYGQIIHSNKPKTAMKYCPLFALSVTFFVACTPPERAPDLIIINAEMTTLDSLRPTAEAVAVTDGRIVKIGSTADIQATADAETKVVDAKGAFVMPGFIEGHGHFKGVGQQQMNLDLMPTKSWEEIAQKVAAAAKTTPPGQWIIGRGWHQEKWGTTPKPNISGWPYHDAISAVSANNPVVLYHASGHALFANAAAMQAAGINTETIDPAGGHIVRGLRNEPIGIFEENAMDIIGGALSNWENTIPKSQRDSAWLRAIRLASKEVLSKGITTFCDAGSSPDDVTQYRRLAEKQQLDVRLWAMLLAPSDTLRDKLDDFPYISDYFTVRAVKAYLDGALGSYGAWLLAPYTDNPKTSGQNTTPLTEVSALAKLCIQHKLQFCVHAIGDRANREVLNTMQTVGVNPMLRWRIEHAQHIDTLDIPRFAKLGVIASMQGIHCTSDAPFVAKRLGVERAKYGAYPWAALLRAGAIIANGTDAPVEDCNPIACFYALVTRRRADTGFEFYPEQRMTRIQALRAYTLDNAFAAFEDNQKGSIKVGKFADFTILDRNLLTCADADILTTQVLKTIVGGVIKYEK